MKDWTRLAGALAMIYAGAFGSTASQAFLGHHDDELNLICYGEGEKPQAQTRYGYDWDTKHHRYESGTRTEVGTSRFDTAVTLEFFGDRGRIRLPRKLIPPIHSGGDDQWWDLRDVEITHDDIRATYKLNGVNQPKVHINRQTGRIKINGIEDFQGTCDAFDPDSHRF